jgi:molybdenum cofactor synthesis domain-containing protein
MLNAAVITISDSRSKAQSADSSGPAACEFLEGLGFEIRERVVIPDDAATIAGSVRGFINKVELVVTTGGTGIGRRDVTPETVTPLFDKILPGFGEIMRTGSFAKTPLSIISRGGAGVAGKTLIVMLPGSPKGVKDCLGLVGAAIKHAMQALGGDEMDCQKSESSSVT